MHCTNHVPNYDKCVKNNFLSNLIGYSGIFFITWNIHCFIHAGKKNSCYVQNSGCYVLIYEKNTKQTNKLVPSIICFSNIYML